LTVENTLASLKFNCNLYICKTFFFNFVRADEKPSNVAFGSTGDREIFPSHVPHSRFGANLKPVAGAPNRGPDLYKVDEVQKMCFFLNFLKAVFSYAFLAIIY